MRQKPQLLTSLFNILFQRRLKPAGMSSINGYVRLLIDNEVGVFLQMSFHAEGCIEVFELAEDFVVGLGLVHIELLVDCVIEMIECFDEFKKLLEMNFLLSLADFSETLIYCFLVQHLLIFWAMCLQFISV